MFIDTLVPQVAFEPDLETQGPNVPHRKRVLNALKTSDDPLAPMLSDRIRNCGRGTVYNGVVCRRSCGIPWCKKCRTRFEKGLTSRLRAYIFDEFGFNEKLARKRLVFVTILYGLSSLDDANGVRRLIAKGRKDLKALKRCFPNVWMQGAFELELIDFNGLLEGCPVKLKTLTSLLVETPALLNEGVCVLVHSHILVDVGKHDETDFRAWLSQRYNKAPRQAYCKKTYKTQTLNKMCVHLGEYPFKERVQFNPSFESKDSNDGRYFTNYHLAKFACLYDELTDIQGVKYLLIGSNREKYDESISDNDLNTNGSATKEYSLDDFM